LFKGGDAVKEKDKAISLWSWNSFCNNFNPERKKKKRKGKSVTRKKKKGDKGKGRELPGPFHRAPDALTRGKRARLPKCKKKRQRERKENKSPPCNVLSAGGKKKKRNTTGGNRGGRERKKKKMKRASASLHPSFRRKRTRRQSPQKEKEKRSVSFLYISRRGKKKWRRDSCVTIMERPGPLEGSRSFHLFLEAGKRREEGKSEWREAI